MSPDPNFYKMTQLVVTGLNALIALGIFCFAAAVYRKRRALGFLVLLVVLGFNAINGISTMFGFNLIASIVLHPPIKDHWLLLQIPQVVTLVGWALLAFSKNGRKEA